jgi:hypothetical protein
MCYCNMGVHHRVSNTSTCQNWVYCAILAEKQHVQSLSFRITVTSCKILLLTSGDESAEFQTKDTKWLQPDQERQLQEVFQ